MSNAAFHLEVPRNEPNLSHAPGTPEREELQAELKAMAKDPVEIPLVIGGEVVKTGKTVEFKAPHDHSLVLALVHQGGQAEIDGAIEAALKARKEWSAIPWQHRTSIFLKAADLLAGPFRASVNAATMLGQNKNAWQAEIDSACELIDFWRFNCYFARQIYQDQPPVSPPGVWNRLEWRGLEGFVFAVTPFNFTAIGGNLPTAPAIMGNAVVWKPAKTQVLSAWVVMDVLRRAGLPPGVINFVTGKSSMIGKTCLDHPALAGIHFTGSTAVFQGMYKALGENIERYAGYPRIVGETGGKDFVFVHPTADPEPVVTALTRGAFEYQGQKCSAVSRAYVPESLWPRVKEGLGRDIDAIRMGPPTDFGCFVNAVIDEAAFDSISGYIDHVKASDEAEILYGGGYDKTKGWFIEPTVVLAKKPDAKTMVEEIFGPVLTIYVYPDDEFEKTLHICDRTSPYALTGAIFARDRRAVVQAERILEHAAGNFYINDKPTGSIVGQQPFGGARASGTNDKAGSWTNLVRWASPRSIKESFVPPTDFRYPFMER